LLINDIRHYHSPYPIELKYRDAFIALLINHPDCFQRTRHSGHITGSSWIINKNRDKALLLHHAKLNKWLQPGGHADGDENVLQVALREAKEETGLISIQPVNNAIFDLDIHKIPARGTQPEHDHYDIRYLFLADEHESLRKNQESKDMQWCTLISIPVLTNNNSSIIRMIKKSKSYK